MLHLLETQIKEANTCACQQRISLPTDDTQSNMSEIYADNLDAICILCVFLQRNPIWMEKQTATRQLLFIY